MGRSTLGRQLGCRSARLRKKLGQPLEKSGMAVWLLRIGVNCNMESRDALKSQMDRAVLFEPEASLGVDALSVLTYFHGVPPSSNIAAEVSICDPTQS